MNVIAIVGRLTRNAEIKETEKGLVARFSVAVNASNDTTFFDCVAFDKTAEVLHDFTRKGSYVAINGYMQCRKYEKDGEQRQSWQVVANRLTLCGGDKQEGEPATANKKQAKAPRKAQQQEEFEY